MVSVVDAAGVVFPSMFVAARQDSDGNPIGMTCARVTQL